MGDFYQYDGDISFHGWDSFKIGPFENKFKSELLENDYSPHLLIFNASIDLLNLVL